MSPKRFAILASGNGSNAQALMESFRSGFIPAELGLVVTDQPNAGVIERARVMGYPLEIVERKKISREAHEACLLEILHMNGIEHILLAGYMRILSPFFLARFPGIVLNIHPSLLPEFPGLHAQAQQWHAGVRVAGATVHQVDEGMDTGAIVLQGSLQVRGDEDAEGLAERILTEVEHVIYARAVVILLERMQRGFDIR